MGLLPAPTSGVRFSGTGCHIERTALKGNAGYPWLRTRHRVCLLRASRSRMTDAHALANRVLLGFGVDPKEVSPWKCSPDLALPPLDVGYSAPLPCFF